MTDWIVLLVLSLGLILLGSELFTNGIEWFGHKLQLAEGAVGSVLAAVGTAMPETMIPIIALVFSKGKESSEIGIGAILGAPLMLSTLAFFVTGAAVFVFTALGRRTTQMSVDPDVLGRDLKSFFLVYAVALGATLLPGRPYKLAAAVFLVAAYVYYVRQTFCPRNNPETIPKQSRNNPEIIGTGRDECDTGPGHKRELGPLHFHRTAEVPRLRIVVSQVVIALALIIGGAHLFVENLSKVAVSSGVSALVLATIITPIATELPEKFNSITWIRRRKDTLALGNISGAMVFQSSILPAIGILFTPWALSSQALAAGIIALAASIFAWAELTWRRRLSPYTLLAGILFYVAYMIYTFVLKV